MDVLTDEEFEKIYNRNYDYVYRLAYFYMKNKYDAEDITSTTFYKLYDKKKVFTSLEYEKRWLLAVASNLCKNKFRYWFSKVVNIDNIREVKTEDSNSSKELLDKVLSLPKKYSISIYLHYYMGYTAKEISTITGVNEDTVFGHLHRGRKLLKDVLGGEEAC